ncbi:uncharacterized protein F4822DRAFT_442905 [Hypoxylon trugodes]|uniref:uncharacterized protein n=1 Tax=Hypoxylon trugodes TaxID=326681 RepID=UPI00219F8781|nr:uncharacterized protein F4822DRAFT_442905 [Hypoxylon trugodes]KAI1389698.1 hypothetical protein F4822DRAFT_442905 [Hypoxylon trugodes]
MSHQVSVPSFTSSTVQKRDDGYWIEAFKFSKDDKVPGLIVSGLNSGKIQFLENPVNAATTSDDGDSPWKVYDIGEFDTPVASIAVDITGNGLLDVVVCHDFGPTMLDCNMDGGWISWLENPGRKALSDGYWVHRIIGRWPAMHRIKAGYFTQSSILEIIGAPVLHGKHDKVTPVPILCFRAPEKPKEATEWQSHIADNEHFTVVHEITPKKLNGPDGLDSLLVASREGVNWLYFEDGKWTHKSIGLGEERTPEQSATSETPGTGDNWGSGNVDIGRVDDDSFAYIATIDPFHGPTVSVYTKVNEGSEKFTWKRHVLDVYGTPNQRMKYGDGPGHFVVCGDFDGDGDDEFLVSHMGPLDRDENEDAIPPAPGYNPNKGIMYYKAIDLSNGVFAKWKIDINSSARVALGDFNGKKKLDIASIGYNVKQYYEEPDPVVTLISNEIAQSDNTIQSVAKIDEPTIVTSYWDGEGIVYFADPSQVKTPTSVALIQVALIAITAEIHPPGGKIDIQKGEGVKVLYGSISDDAGERHSLGNEPFPHVASTTSTQDYLTADKVKGAIVIRITPLPTPQGDPEEWDDAAKVPVNTTFDLSKAGLVMPPFKFTKVEDLWWGGAFKGREFYNLTGFNFRFLDSKTHIAHMQFWTAGTNVSAGAHNHSNDYFEEIHMGLSLGTKTGGMWQIKPENEDLTQDEAEALPAEGYICKVIHPLEEHGGMWKRDADGNALRGKNNVVVYPWHKWQGGEGPNIDVWLALEFNPDLPL